MQGAVRRLDECRVCGRNTWLDILSFGAVPLANGFLRPAENYDDEVRYPLDVVVCKECWLVSLAHVVDPELLFSHYVYVSSNSDQMRQHMRRIVDMCVARAGLTDRDLVVEIGSNTGNQLELFAAAGMRIVGVDPARNLAEIANENGIDTVGAFFGAAEGQQIAANRGTARLVLGRQCFAHIHDVHDVLDGVTAVLAPDGLLAIEVPYLVDLLDENQVDTIYHEHLSYWSVGVLSRLFETHGLSLVDVERVPVHGGSIVVFAARASVGRTPAPAVAAILELEDSRGLRTDAPYLEFAGRARQVTTAVGDLVRDLVASGNRVAGYGAPSKGTTLLQFCGLGAAELVFCSDTTPLKHGKVLPGSHIPVWSPEQAQADPPDYYLLLAWNYAKEIIHKERSFLERGGRFIVPIPQPKVISAESVLEFT
jgi:novobiocin biosynthesis protein NovU